MRISNFQKILINEILSKKVFDLESFFDIHFLETDPAKQSGVHQIANTSINCSPDECISRTVDFLSLWKKLDDAKLIYTATDSSKTELFKFFTSFSSNQNRPSRPDFMFNQITRDYIQKVIFPDEALKVFLENGYKTDDELYSDKEEGDKFFNAHSTYPENEMISEASTLSKDTSKVFVVHGRNEAARMAIFDFLRALDLKPVEWNEAIASTGKATPSIDEILDAAFDQAQAILVLLTGDDLVRLGSVYSENEEAEVSLSPQPRPNVLFEAGMAFGRKSKRTLLVQLGDIRPFSDIAGKHIVHLDNTVEKRQNLLSRLRIAGCNVDVTHKTDWLKTGDFNACVFWPDKEGTKKTQENNLKQSYHFENIKRQRELLLEFLGKPKAEFYTLHGVGLTWDQNWRREKIKIIGDWVEKNNPFFPLNVRKTLTSIKTMAGTMFTEDGLKLTFLPDAREIIAKDFELVENYLNEIEKELNG